jgi:hypothetical protein
MKSDANDQFERAIRQIAREEARRLLAGHDPAALRDADEARRVEEAQATWPTVLVPHQLEREPITYVVGFVEDAVKIGTTVRFMDRLRAYNTHLPVDVRCLHVLPGNWEQRLHSVARRWHIRREWFHRACLPAVVAWLPSADDIAERMAMRPPDGSGG